MEVIESEPRPCLFGSRRPTHDDPLNPLRISEPEFDASVFLLPVTTRHVVLNRVWRCVRVTKLAQTREFTFPNPAKEDEKPTLNTTYTGFSIYGKALCLVLEPPTGNAPAPLVRKKKAKSAEGGIENWFVNQQREEPGIDDA